MAGVKGRSGRQKEKFLTQAEWDAMRDGLNLAEVGGTRELVIRAMGRAATGTMPVRLFKDVIAEGAIVLERLGREARADQRTAKLREIANTIDEARLAGRNLRDVGPPDDGMSDPGPPKPDPKSEEDDEK